MRKVFIDCGFHHGEGLAQFVRKLGINSEWSVHCFEANPACFMHLRLMERYDFVPDGRLTMIEIQSHAKAVWIADGEIEFCQENHYRSESGSPTDGKSLTDGWASRAKDLAPANAGWYDQSIKVESIDFSKFVTHLRGNEVYCKMDIEGAEYPVLRKLIRDGNANIFKKIWIEFHDDIPGESMRTKKNLITELSKFTQVELWD